MSKGYIIGGGGSTKLYACIGVTYPSGSTCTCTNGTKTLKAKGTSGTAIFNVPSTGTWTVTAANGDKTASKSVSITAEGQTENVTLAYEYVLYEAGSKKVTFTKVDAGYAAKYRTITEGDNSVSFYVEGGDTVHSSDWSTSTEASTVVSTGWATDSIDLSAYNSIKVTLPSLACNEAKTTAVILGIASSDPNINVGSGVKNSVAQTIYVPSATSETDLTITCDVSSISSGYLVFGVWSNRGNYAGKGTATATMNKLWLE